MDEIHGSSVKDFKLHNIAILTRIMRHLDLIRFQDWLAVAFLTKPISPYLLPRSLPHRDSALNRWPMGAHCFFQLISRRYERASTIFTSNKSYGEWGDIFRDHVIAAAILDRILHHCTTVNIKGDSYRLKERKRQGLIPKNFSREVWKVIGSSRSLICRWTVLFRHNWTILDRRWH